MAQDYADIHTVEDLQEVIGQAAEAGDLETLEALQQYFVETDAPGDAPFVPAIALDDTKLETAGAAAESFSAIETANSLDRATRLWRYRGKRRSGYTGPVIVSEGDSWFQYPFFLTDIIDNIDDEYAVLSLGGAGHHLADMVRIQDEYKTAIRNQAADFFLLSGGGNDMVGGGNLANFVRPIQPDMSAQDLLDQNAFNQFRRMIRGLYEQVLTDLTQEFPNLTILFHGYDYVCPVEGGPWLGTPLASQNVPDSLWADFIAILIDQLNEELQSLESMFPGRAFHIDVRRHVGPNTNNWNDELHPKNPGYKRVADRFLERIRVVENAGVTAQPVTGTAVFSADELRPVVRSSLSPGTPEVARSFMMRSQSQPPASVPESDALEAIIEPQAAALSIIDVGQPAAVITGEEVSSSADPCSSLAAWQAWFDEEDKAAYKHFKELWPKRDVRDSDERLEARRELSGVRTLERIINDSNLFPINFLARGQQAARAVGRISVVSRYGVSLGTGTGFLVAPGLLLTNNHVLSRISNAAKSFVLFDYEFDVTNALRQTERFAFTDDIFFTDPEYDFTLVSVAKSGRNGTDIAQYGALPMIRQSGSAIKKEPVSILQHPDGAPKQIAMRDSRIIGRKEKYIYYTTDTNPGSSGAPVVNDDWLPVALHHRSVPDFEKPCQYVANRGIRISAIIERLDVAAEDGDEMARTALRLIEPPLQFSIGPGFTPAAFDAASAEEALREPFHEVPYDNRNGYDGDFLGDTVPLPALRDTSVVSCILGTNEHVIPYEHFSVVVHKDRRLALFTASNVDVREEKQEPEPDRNYSRDGLSGLGENDREKWFKDPRIPGQHQLPDRFFTKDNQAFDKGDVVRRTDVTWGDTFEQVRRANGDTYHTTNCTPQVKGFNRSNLSGLWGKLENLIFADADTQLLTVFAGSILDPADQSFQGVDDEGEILVQIPAKYWKVVVARNQDELESYAFVLEQDLSNVPLEFAVNAQWRQRMISIPSLEVLVRHFTFSEVIHATDQADQVHGEMLRRSESMELFN